ncbi:hypothetical protein CK203_034949 [Vitis vinifera]|uniref:Uncharacterized protein n=1 Tax=Vitis vinifera TaxID=29760 RepID=A0A438ECT6_VITVI|nr:hypothetical protein CK203_091551 [Vitis vinifera]RVW65103.1 hypothetical protein CK203_034949 [Vitis vinifera]
MQGNLSGQRQGQPVFITRLEVEFTNTDGYRSASASESNAYYSKNHVLLNNAIVVLINSPSEYVQDHSNYSSFFTQRNLIDLPTLILVWTAVCYKEGYAISLY